MPSKLIVGLGNPGNRYTATRHNAGRWLIESLSGHLGVRLSGKKKLQSSVAEAEWENQSVVLAHPETFMNLSGEAVYKLVRQHGIEVQQDLLVVVDDLALPFGCLRLRTRGSSGGHNGLKSIETVLGTSDFARLRIGIGRPAEENEAVGRNPVSDYVLSRFTPEEKAVFPGFLASRGIEACRLWISGSAEAAMSVVNTDLESS